MTKNEKILQDLELLPIEYNPNEIPGITVDKVKSQIKDWLKIRLEKK